MRARREIYHREGSCLSLALDKWARMKPVCVCVLCIHACVCVLCVYVCVGHGYTIPPFKVKHTHTHMRTHFLGCSLRSRERLFFCFSSMPLQEEGGEREGRKEAKGTRGGGIMFPPCVHYG